jgi:hypothetical protein
VAPVGAGLGVVDDHAPVLVAVGHVDLAGCSVDFHAGGLAQPRRVGAAGLRPDLADLQHEAAVAREFQHLPVVLAVARDPDESPGIDVDAVLVAGPVVAGAGPSPRAQHAAGGVELQHRRRRHAALRLRRIERGAGFVLGQAARTLQHPDVIVGVDRHAAHLAEDPVVRQRSRPRRIDMKGGRRGRRGAASRGCGGAAADGRHRARCAGQHGQRFGRGV